MRPPAPVCAGEAGQRRYRLRSQRLTEAVAGSDGGDQLPRALVRSGGVVTPEPVVVVSHFTSPYQVELFNEIETQRPGWVSVYYLHRTAPERQWTEVAIRHSHGSVRDNPALRAHIRDAAFVVFNYYNDTSIAGLIRARAATGLPWSFWAERPGYRYPLLARLARFARLRPLRRSTQPIWGIGEWAVGAYRREFGPSHAYVNLPYYSDLSRFAAGAPSFSDQSFTFLFSGSLIRRKGADLLATAFREVASQLPNVRLTVMGTGPLEAELRRTLKPCEDRVAFVGFRDWTELPQVYQRAQALCVPSRHDGWGLVVPEGLATGLPVIATDRTGAALDLLEHGSNGWVVKAGAVEPLADAMRLAATLSGDRWRQMSANARSSVAAHTLSQGATRLIAAVEQALAARVTS